VELVVHRNITTVNAKAQVRFFLFTVYCLTVVSSAGTNIPYLQISYQQKVSD